MRVALPRRASSAARACTTRSHERGDEPALFASGALNSTVQSDLIEAADEAKVKLVISASWDVTKGDVFACGIATDIM